MKCVPLSTQHRTPALIVLIVCLLCILLQQYTLSSMIPNKSCTEKVNEKYYIVRCKHQCVAYANYAHLFIPLNYNLNRAWHHIGYGIHEKKKKKSICLILVEETRLRPLKEDKTWDHKEKITKFKSANSSQHSVLFSCEAESSLELCFLIKPVLHPRSPGRFPSNTSHRLPGKTPVLHNRLS